MTREGQRPNTMAANYDNSNGKTYHPNKWKNDERKVKYQVQNIKGTDHDDDTATDIIQHNDEPNIELEQDYSEYPDDGNYWELYEQGYYPDEYGEDPEQTQEPFQQQDHFLP